MNGLRGYAADYLFDFTSKRLASFQRSHWHGDHNLDRFFSTERDGSSAHRSSGCQSVIDQNDRATLYIESWTVASVKMFATFQLFLLSLYYGIDDRAGKIAPAHGFGVQDTHAATSDCSHRQFLVPRHAEFANEKNV
jgi:hypothetical protein